MTTIGGQFADTYCIVEPDTKRAFLLFPNIIEHPYMLSDPRKYIFQEHVMHHKIFEYASSPAIRTRFRFVRAIRRCKNNAIELYTMLNQIFREDMIKACFKFPDIWLLNNNELARKQRATEFSQKRHLIKQLSQYDRNLHAECVAATHLSKIEIAKQSIY